MKPKIPKGYRLLKVGEKRPKDYMHLSLVGYKIGQERGIITEQDMTNCGPYLAPIKKKAKR